MPERAAVGKISISLAALGVLVTILVWLTNSAIAMENRITKCEVMKDAITEMKLDIRDIKADVRKLLISAERVRDERKGAQ